MDGKWTHDECFTSTAFSQSRQISMNRWGHSGISDLMISSESSYSDFGLPICTDAYVDEAEVPICTLYAPAKTPVMIVTAVTCSSDSNRLVRSTAMDFSSASEVHRAFWACQKH